MMDWRDWGSIIAVALLMAFTGFMIGQLSIEKHCKTDTFFSIGGKTYECLPYKKEMFNER